MTPSSSKRKKKALTKTQKRLLMYPPTPKTWFCESCDMVNSGSKKECIWCKITKPRKPKLVWPLYLDACEKLGITPGVRVKWHRSINKPMIWTGQRYRFLDENGETDHPKIKKIIKRKNN